MTDLLPPECLCGPGELLFVRLAPGGPFESATCIASACVPPNEGEGDHSEHVYLGLPRDGGEYLIVLRRVVDGLIESTTVACSDFLEAATRFRSGVEEGHLDLP